MKEIITARVKKFYENLPFNFSTSSERDVAIIKNRNQIETYKDFHDVLSASKSGELLDIGCGIGWLTNSVGYHYPLKAYGIDLCRKALRRAVEISETLKIGNRVRFINCDLFHTGFKRPFRFVNSLGALHHTFSVAEALKAAAGLVEKGGYMHIGLYHKFGREPFLDLFKKYREKVKAGEELSAAELNDAYKAFKELNGHISDEIFLESWFRDQVLHPHESQHTFKEVAGMLSDLGFRVVSTGINKYAPIVDINRIFDYEKRYRDISLEKNVRSKAYFPGFFTVLARKI